MIEKYIDQIAIAAEAKWGPEWRAAIARAYVEMIQESDPTATYSNRRSQIYRVFREHVCTADTFYALVKCVGGNLLLELPVFKA